MQLVLALLALLSWSTAAEAREQRIAVSLVASTAKPKPGSTITVEGEVKRDGKDKKAIRIVAKKFYPG